MSFLQSLVDAVNPVKGITKIIGAIGGAGSQIVGSAGAALGPPTPTYIPTTQPAGGDSFGDWFKNQFAGVDITGGVGSKGSWWQRNATTIIVLAISIIGFILMIIFWPFSGPRKVTATSSSRSSSRSRAKSSSRSRSKSKGPLRKGSPEAKRRMAQLRSMKRRKRK